MIPYGSFVVPRIRLKGAGLAIAIALACGGMVLAPAVRADEMTCNGVKRALVSANLGLMRIERGPLPVAPEQAAMAIGQMTALENIASITCSPVEADKIFVVVNPRVDGLQRLLPVAPAGADDTSTPDQSAEAPPANATASASAPPTPPGRPAAADHPESRQHAVNPASCTRVYYMKGNHRMWRCKR
ncbi:hypothetical protein GCM10007874_65390 [Labrys miyagiensis]|uniref:Uncharacterized protein n=1 Tax=Labrys miyagiensis TaxID=346912 RepID=A0ABQ6CT81_9HYPH|nr:hypothetical protein [Labrys miyagiensis]GLS23518.1 hypothetical protein GCM10007874_65390 [Labrys miyagiensis]